MHIYEVIYLLCYLHRSERLFLDLDQLFRRLHDVYVFVCFTVTFNILCIALVKFPLYKCICIRMTLVWVFKTNRN